VLYLNVVFHEHVVPPLDKKREIADPRNDRSWLIIPMLFGQPRERLNLEGHRCLTFDVHVNPAVVVKMKEDTRAMRSITNYLVLKFQEHLEGQYVLHKRTIKHLKQKRYKCPKGSESQRVTPFLLPKEHDVRNFKAAKDRLLKEAEEKQRLAPKKEDIKLTPATCAAEKEEPEVIKMPSAPAKKVVVIQEMSKTIPNFELRDEEGGFTMTFNVEEEASAKDIELDISGTQLKLNSANYEFRYDFKAKLGFEVDPEDVKAKFNKTKRTLALTFKKLS